MWLTGHLVAEPERHFGLKFSLHPAATQTKIPRPAATHGTCETYWKTRQNMKDRSTDHGGAHQYATMIVTPDTLKANPAEPDTADKTRMNRVAI